MTDILPPEIMLLLGLGGGGLFSGLVLWIRSLFKKVTGTDLPGGTPTTTGTNSTTSQGKVTKGYHKNCEGCVRLSKALNDAYKEA